MEFKKFSLDNRQKVEEFEIHLKHYMVNKTRGSVNIFLVKAFDVFQNIQDIQYRNRLFSAFLDITINYVLLYCDQSIIGDIHNKYFIQEESRQKNILDSQIIFTAKMDTHQAYSCFILRYRALWDKLMGFLVLLFKPNEYERFTKAKSRKNCFIKIAKEINCISEIFLLQIENILKDVDEKFRTQEAHGTGSLRNYTFSTISTDYSDNDYQARILLFHWNSINSFIGNEMNNLLEHIQQNQNFFN